MSDPHLSQTIFGDEEGHGSHRVETVRRRRRNRGPLGCAIVAVTALAVLLAAILALGQLKPLVSSLTGGGSGGDYSSSDVQAEKAKVTITSGQTASQIGSALEKAGVVKSASAFVDAATANPKWSTMQPGTYSIAKHSPADDVVAYIVDPAHKVNDLVTVREGLRKWEVYELLSQKTGRPVSEYEAAEKNATALGLPAAANGDIEGWLFPSSYPFTKSTTAADQLKAMVTQAKTQIDTLGIPADKVQDTLIVASIVEAEGRLDADRPKIARVIDNRLVANPPMRLQLDSTVVYPVRKRVLATTDEDRQRVNGYNTYTQAGLPKGPIANPGMASLKAAAHPADGPWLYFVAVNPVTGETKFATTFDEHQQYVKEWQTFCQNNPGSC